MRWSDKDRELLRKAVRNYNLKINRVKARSPEIADIQPDKVGYKNYKNNITDCKEFNRTIKNLKSYTKRGSENPYITETGVVVTNYEKDKIDRTFKRINAQRRAEIKKYDVQNGFASGLPTADRIAPRKNLIQEIKPKDWNNFVTHLENNRYNMGQKERNEYYKENMLKGIEKQFGKTSELYSRIENFGSDNIMSLYFSTPYFNIDFIYEPQDYDDISTILFDAIDEFSVEEWYNIYVCDFETTTDKEDCRVWATGVININTLDFIHYNNIDNFFEYFKDKKETCYFHNLRFDGEFIISYLFTHGFNHVKDKKELESNTFTTLISDKGVFYSMTICFKKNHKVNHSLTLLDSLKVLPFSVDVIAKTFNLEFSKLKIEYNQYRPINHKLTEQEISYLKNDVLIVALALQELFKQNLVKMTTASNALSHYKELMTKDKFEKYFPILDYNIDKDIRKSYKGGFTYLNPKYKNSVVSSGFVLDVNSLYPSVMYYNMLPYDQPIYYTGKYEKDKLYNIYIQHICCMFELKENSIPTIQIKGSIGFIPTEYLTNSKGEYIDLYLTNVDLDLFFDNYNVYGIEYISGYKFKSTDKLFKQYIDYWIGIKNQATIDGNAGLRTIAKLMLNSLYGKFALNPNVQSKYPTLDENGVIKYALGQAETRDAIYVPVGVFVTSYARQKTISSAKKMGDRFIYADTDSLHLIDSEIPDCLEIDDIKLGAWKIEEVFKRGKYIRAKTYIEDVIEKSDKIEKFKIENPELLQLCSEDSILKITCAGMPKQCYKEVTFDNFKTGAIYSGKLAPKHVKGGIVLDDIPFSIKI